MIIRLLREAALYIGASPHSRLHQLGALRDLDERLLRDIGICREAARTGRPIDNRELAHALADRSGVSPGI